MTQKDPHPIRVLLVEDDPEDYELLLDLLASCAEPARYQLDWTASFDTALADLRGRAHALYLVDFRLGARTGLELLHQTSADPLRPPVIILTGNGSRAIDREAMAAGAADYLVKDGLKADLLERSLRYCFERTRLHQRLAESERCYRLLFDLNPMPMCITDTGDGRISAANRAFVRLYGYSGKELLHRRFASLQLEASEGQQAEPEQLPLRIGELPAMREAHCRADGTVLSVLVATDRVLLNNEPARLVVVSDISAQLAADARIHQSERALRKVLGDASDALLVVDAQNRVRFVNAAAPALLGHSVDGMLDQTLPMKLPQHDCDGMELTDGAGTRHVVDIRTAESDWNGQPALIVAIRDMTTARANEGQLRLLQRALESSPNGVSIADARLPDLPLIYVNPAFERITGYRAEEILGRNCRFLQGDQRDQPELAPLRLALAARTEHDTILTNFRKDGTPFKNQIRLSPVRDASGEVTHFVATQIDVTAQLLAQEERLWLSTHDALTNLPKYAGVEQQWQRRLEQARDRAERVGVLFLDIDRFRTVNDTLGYAVGDAALATVARRLQAAVPAGACCARFAGDEFVLLIPGVGSYETLVALADQICDAVAEPLEMPGPTTLLLSGSIGLSVFPDTGDILQNLLHQADLAMHRAKRTGRHSIHVYDQALEGELNDRIALGSQLLRALKDEQFILHFQPQLNAHGGELLALEALVRWQHPQFGVLPPGRFIPVAERTGLMPRLGQWVMQSACRHLRQWTDQGLHPPRIAVNVSAGQLQLPDFVESVARTLREHDIPPALLELEITENLLIDNIEHAEKQMRALKQIGVTLALDDFGKGYSSLGYLQRLPFDRLKIDESFIQSLGQSQGNAAITRAIITLGHQLDMKVVAEGVETAAQLGYLRRHHCDVLQGHLFSEAVPASAIPELLRKQWIAPEYFRDPSEGRTLLLLDDEENILHALVRVLRRDGYRILTARNAGEAFDLLARNHVQVIVSDQRMPGLSGTEFLSQVKSMYPPTMRLVLSGYTDLASVTDAINRGAIYKFLTKPWDDEELRAHIHDAFQRYDGI